MINNNEEIAVLQDQFYWPALPTMILTCKTESHGLEILNRIREVLLIVIPRTPGSGLSLHNWRETLPNWFVKEFADEMTTEELQTFVQLPVEERLTLRPKWPLSSWIYWFDDEDEERMWRWKGSKILNEYEFWIAIDIEEYPTAIGALEWLLKASGVKEISKEIAS